MDSQTRLFSQDSLAPTVQVNRYQTLLQIKDMGVLSLCYPDTAPQKMDSFTPCSALYHPGFLGQPMFYPLPRMFL